MRTIYTILLAITLSLSSFILSAQTRTVHVFVALADNLNQGIVRVPELIGNGQDPRNNLYWGCGYGIKTYFSKHSGDWKLLKTIKNPKPGILERLLFKHVRKEVYLLADAYDGREIKQTTIDFLQATGGNQVQTITHGEQKLPFGGGSNLLAYIGHDGLMGDFHLGKMKVVPANDKKRDAIILACYSKSYFIKYIEQSKANPLIWTSGLMAPEAYTLEWALDGWVLNETNAQIRERAAKAYNHYQKCGMRGARNLLRTGY
ncbi:MAG: hypothetical protein ACPGJS_21720 [Flammeovirgaceae bacterium]